MDTLNLKNFGDYREFLKYHFETKRATNPAFSYGMWSKRIGLKATSSLTKIINGEREPGIEVSEKLIQYFNFSSTETQYFNDLVRLAKIKNDPRLSMMLMERMGREHPDANLTILEDKTFAIISNWFCLTIREMTKLADFVEDPEWIKQRLMFEVSSAEIKDALENLLHQGLLKRKDGRLTPSPGLLHTKNDEASKAIRTYHSQMLENARLSLESTPVDLREFQAETITINPERIPEAKEFVREFKSKFAKVFEEQIGKETYQFQIQLFPLTKN